MRLPVWPGRGPISDLATTLRRLHPLSVDSSHSVERQRQLLADVLRLIGDRLVQHPSKAPTIVPSVHASNPPAPAEMSLTGSSSLSPRLQQTLKCLLAGQSEKEAAQQLKLSPHTVHVYVKTLYKRFGVSTRAELLAKHVRV